MRRMKTFLERLTLSQQFMLASFLILLAGMAGIGAWVERQVVTGVIHRTGAATALYVDSFVSPHLQSFGQSGELLPAQVQILRGLLSDTPMGKQIVALKIWDTRGRVLYSTNSSEIGQSYPMHEGMLRARLGEVVSDVSTLDEQENQALAAAHRRLLETYSPIWLSGTDQVIGVAEFYQSTAELEREIAVLVRRSWWVVGLAITLIYLLLAGFVRRASDTILLQQADLSRKVAQLSALLAQNQELQLRIRRAAGSVALMNEGYLRRVGAELHDGPAQDLGLSILKLDALAGRIERQSPFPAGVEAAEQLNEVGLSLQNALKEMRAIAAGLSLPQLAGLDLHETVQRVVRTHERRTATQVALELGELPARVTLPLKTTVYRLIQEALNNAYRHAAGLDQSVVVGCRENFLSVQVSDSGPGFDLNQVDRKSGRLGLFGMRERVESLGGQFQIQSSPGHGTTILALLPCLQEEEVAI